MHENENTVTTTKDGGTQKVLLTLFCIAFMLLVAFKMNFIITLAKVLIGFGAVIFIHELGHFLACKITGIKVEAFSIGFPPTLFSFQKKKGGLKFTFLPGSLGNDASDSQQQDDSQDGTDYRIGIIPIGGFVKPLGQEDVGAAEHTDDPNAYCNKSIPARITVLSAGVVCNIIFAVIIFMAVFTKGLDLPPAIVGNVIPDSPAEIAGLQPGDRIVEIEGDTFIDYTNLEMAAAIASKGEEISIRIQRADNTEKTLKLVPEETELYNRKLKMIGIKQASSLQIAKLKPEENEMFFDRTGLQSEDLIIKCNGIPVENSWQFETIIANSITSTATVEVKRYDSSKQTYTIETVELPVFLDRSIPNFKTIYEPTHIFSMVPRLKVDTVSERISDLFQKNDIILQAGDVKLPTFDELRDITEAHENRNLEITILRNNKQKQVLAKPIRQGNRVIIGLGLIYDTDNPILAKTIESKGGPIPLDIPSGATITSVDGIPVANFYDVIRIIKQNLGQRITLDYRLDTENAGAVKLDIPATHDYITAKSKLGFNLPFRFLTEKYKAENPLSAIRMGFKKTQYFVITTYLTIKGIVTRNIDPSNLSGPVGILTMSYEMVDNPNTSLAHFAYFLGLINVALAVFNFLPFPVLDGGHVLFLIIEKIKGSPVSIRIQAGINYAGAVLLLAFALWVTYNDIMNILIPKFR